MRYLILGFVVILSACGGTAPSGAARTPAPSVATPCTASVRNADLTGWQRVQARGFTFCVPSNWSGSRTRWRHGEASITWGTGQPPARTATATRVVRVPAGDPIPPSVPDQAPGGEARRFSESIGGVDAELYANQLGQYYATGATWNAKSIYFQGDAHDPLTAELELTIYRTVRFATS